MAAIIDAVLFSVTAIIKGIDMWAKSDDECRELMQELKAMEGILVFVRNAKEDGAFDSTTFEGLSQELERCTRILQPLVTKLFKMQGERILSRFLEELFGDASAKRIRKQLSQVRVSLITVLTMCNMSILIGLQKKAEQLERSTKSIDSKLDALLKNPQAPVTLTCANAITVVSWFGTSAVVPANECGTFAQFYSNLEALSRKWPAAARDRIRRAQCILTCDEAVRMLSATTWAEVVRPGRTVRVSYLFSRYPPPPPPQISPSPPPSQPSARTRSEFDSPVGNNGMPNGRASCLPPAAALKRNQSRVGVRLCPQCLDGIPALRDAFEHYYKTPGVVHVGCMPEHADWYITGTLPDVSVEKTQPRQAYVLHHATFPGCDMYASAIPMAVVQKAIGAELPHKVCTVDMQNGGQDFRRSSSFPYTN